MVNILPNNGNLTTIIMDTISCQYEPIGEATHQYLDVKFEDFKCTIFGYKSNKTRTFLYHFIGIILLGVPYVFYSWLEDLQTLKYKKTGLKNADTVLIKDNHHQQTFIKVKTEICNLLKTESRILRSFCYRKTKYVWLVQKDGFGTLKDLMPLLSVEEYVNNRTGIYDVHFIDLLKLYGPNTVEIEVKSYWKLFVEEVFNAFYVFQAFSVALWCFDSYYIYAGCVFFLTLFSVATALFQTRKQSVALHDLVEGSKCASVTVIRLNHLMDNGTQEVEPSELVPGDLIVLPKADFLIPCDSVLITGQCIVNESMLTGESVPVTKSALIESGEQFDIHLHKRHVLFSGTQMLQSRYYGGEHVLARVLHTGFDTAKGSLVKSILFPAPVGLKFYKDSLKFLFALFCIAAGGTAYCLYMYVTRHAPLREIIIRSLDIITIVVPPALPAAMTIGIGYSQTRLRKLGIFCISPPKINVCGKLKLACFDKTGTLTHDGLDFHSVLPVIGGKFVEQVEHSAELEHESRLVQAMATCHSLTTIGGRLNGDPLDFTMFEFTKWEMEEPGEDETTRFDMVAPSIVKPPKGAKLVEDEEFPYEIGIIREFPFSSTLQCMSVICREITSPKLVAFAKGAPEKIATMANAASIPPNFVETLAQYTSQGFRVIALAYKDLPTKFRWKEAQRAKRALVECDLTFLGLIVLQNTLKPQSRPVINLLHRARIRTLMITGDNLQTAISVGRNCEMLAESDDLVVVAAEGGPGEGDSIPRLTFSRLPIKTNAICVDRECKFAIDGRTWAKVRSYYPDLLPGLLLRTAIFARFQPEQKTQLVTHLQGLDYVVAMVGDGANDCGALKAANIGVSLSQAEASVAAPFTSSIGDITCLVHLMLEGRCALVTSFAVFKYMALYSLIQFTTILILYRCFSILGDTQFLFIDLVITTSLAVTIGMQGPSKRLSVKRPMGSLVSLSNLIPLLLQIFTCILVQVGALVYLAEQDWFEPVPDHEGDETIVCWENTVLFLVSCFQYVILAFVYSKGRPYRQMLVTNFWFLISALSLVCFLVYLLVWPDEKVTEFFELIYLPSSAYEQILFRYKLLALPVLHFVAANVIEFGVADCRWLKVVVHFVKRKKVPKNKYKLLLNDENELNRLLNCVR